MFSQTSLSVSAVAALAIFSSQVKAQDISSSAAVQSGIEGLSGSPACVEKCQLQLATVLPPCSWAPPTDSKETPEEITTNIISCQCTDKDYMSQAFSCILNSCKSNTTAISAEFDSRYTACAGVGVKLAPPSELLKELSVKVPSGASVPSSASGQAQVTVFPSQTATVAWPSSLWASESSAAVAAADVLTSILANPSAVLPSGVSIETVPTPSGTAVGTGAAGTGSGSQGTNGTAPAASTAKPTGPSSTSSGAASSQTGSAARNTAFGGIIGLAGLVGLMAAL